MKPVPLTLLLTISIITAAGTGIVVAQTGVLDSLFNGETPLFNGTAINFDNKTYHILITPFNETVVVPEPEPPTPICIAGFFFNTTSRECQVSPIPVVNETQPPIDNGTIPPVVNSTDITGIVTKIIDGDTLEVTTAEGKVITIRPPIINTPNSGEPGRAEATAFTTNLCLDKPVRVDVDDGIPGGPPIVDGSGTGRTIGQVYCDGQFLDKLLIDNGLAKLTYTQYCPTSEFRNQTWLCPAVVEPPPPGPAPVGNATTQKIIVVGDIENSKEGLAVYNQIKLRNPNLVAVLGDLGYQANLAWFKSTYGTFGDKVACVIGNHEAANEDGSTSLQTEALAYCGDSYYVKKLGNTVIFGINTNGDLTKQLAGVKTLVTDSSFMNGIKSVHVLSHKPCLTPPNSHHPGPESSSIKAFCDGVKSSVPSTVKVFYDQAHNHVLSSSADGTYKQSGAGGKSHYTCPTTVTSAWFCNNVKYGFLEYVITPDGTTTSQFIDANGVVIK